MNKKILSLLVLFLCFHPVQEIFSQVKLTPDLVLQRASEKIAHSKGLEVLFNIKSKAVNGTGSIKGYGDKFNVQLPDVRIWYNGKDMFTFNARTSETMVINPTKEDLQESNPFLYINNYKDNFKASFSQPEIKGKYIVTLIPNSVKGNIKKILLTINSNTFTIERIEVEMNGGSNIQFITTSFKTDISFSANEFEYPKNKFPDIEIIDMR